MGSRSVEGQRRARLQREKSFIEEKDTYGLKSLPTALLSGKHPKLKAMLAGVLTGP